MAANEKSPQTDQSHLSDEELLERVIQLGFCGDPQMLNRFCDKLRSELPAGTAVALRGSVVTNRRWSDGMPFDADGQGTSDLDVTLIGDKVMEYWKPDEFYIPALHTKPLGDEHPDTAPGLDAVRRAVQEMVGRPVNFQATSNIILFARDVLLGEPYLKLFEPDENA